MGLRKCHWRSLHSSCQIQINSHCSLNLLAWDLLPPSTENDLLPIRSLSVKILPALEGQSHTHCHRKLLCSASPDCIVTVSPHDMCHHFLVSHSALFCAYLCISLSSLPIRQTEAAWEQEPVAFPLPLVLAQLINMGWDEWNWTLLLRSSDSNNSTELLCLKLEEETSKHQMSSPAVFLLWMRDKPEMALSELVFFGWNHDKTWGVSGKKKKNKVFKTVRM